ncbi:MAG: HAMP domain-containing protein [Lachnospiraceae bacterium]|jgi:two-component system sensor histidine kinase YesM|nr:HAMP domain-containing protein [Lachnospiraceae bacterium]
MGKEKKYQRTKVRFSIRTKIVMLSILIALPFVIFNLYLLSSMANYSRAYDDIVSNMTIANNYNLNFKEEMDESLYKLVVGYVTFDTIATDETLKDPYELIGGLRSEFGKLVKITTEPESRMWLESLLRNIDTLEKRVRDIEKSVREGDNYNKNIRELDDNIYILTELIQDDIQYYIYYQTNGMDVLNQNLNRQVDEFIVLWSLIVGSCVCVALLIAIFLVHGVLRPVERLYHVTEQLAEGNFDVRAKVYSGDEIAVLANSFNNMADNMQLLIDKAKEDERKMRQADLRLLQEQINPHFLYNTLDTIVWLIESNETEQAVEMVVTLSSFFRLVLSKGKEQISIREEEKHITSYLEIQKMRYHDIMEYDVQIDKVLYDYQILKLTLQPLVENALYHGIKYKRAKGYIHISGEKEDNLIRLTVRDNGVGMDENELEEIREEIERPCQETEKGFGLANVNERIHMYFGYQYGMTIDSKKGWGTIVEITIPAIKIQSAEKAE